LKFGNNKKTVSPLKEVYGPPKPDGYRITIIYAPTNLEIVTSIVDSAKQTLLEKGVRKNDIRVISVPSAFDLPFVVKSLSGYRDSKSSHAIIPIAVVIRDEFRSDYELISGAVSVSLYPPY
jgi:6,7-dimethyl-8-ribityllumazine synthase